MKKEKKVRDNCRWAVLIGAGIALTPIHNRWLTELVTQNGEVGFFIPSFGYAIWIGATLFFMFVYDNWYKNEKNKWRFNWRGIDFGSKGVFIPLLVIVGAIGLSGITAGTLQDKLSPLLMALSLFALYLVARKLGKDILLPLAIGAGIASLGVIIYGFIHTGQITGGFVFEGNYDIVVGYALLGVALFIHKLRWLLAGLALMAMFLSGSPEAVFSVSVVAIVVLWRRDWNKRLVIAVSPTLLLMIVWFGLGYGQELYARTFQIAETEVVTSDTFKVVKKEIVKNEVVAIVASNTVKVVKSFLIVEDARPPLVDASPASVDASPASVDVSKVKGATSFRLAVIKEAMTNIKPVGEGYYLTAFVHDTVHNVPLIIVQQLGYPGILAGLAWLWICGYCLVKTRWRYAWVLILSLSIFDHFIWTQLAPYWWVLIGVSTASTLHSDSIFKRIKNEN